MDRETAKQAVIAEIDRRADDLLRVSREIHAHPELAYEEHFAHDVLTEAITGAGLPVTSHAYGLDTAFVSVTGPGEGPLVAVLCEYDALPGIGHACGHNIIAAAGLGAGLAAAAVAPRPAQSTAVQVSVATARRDGRACSIEFPFGRCRSRVAWTCVRIRAPG